MLFFNYISSLHGHGHVVDLLIAHNIMLVNISQLR